MDSKIREVLRAKSPQVWTVAASDLVGEAAEIMLERRIGSVVVLEGDRVVGMLDERDVLVQVSVPGHQPWAVRVGEIVSRKAFLVAHPEQTVTQVIAVMTEAHQRHVPVCAGRRLLGVVSLGDLGRWLAEDQAMERIGREDEVVEPHLA